MDFGDVQRAVPERDAVGVIKPFGDRRGVVGAAVAVPVGYSVYFAFFARADEEGTPFTHRQRAGTRYVVGVNVDPETGRELYLLERQAVSPILRRDGRRTRR